MLEKPSLMPSHAIQLSSGKQDRRLDFLEKSKGSLWSDAYPKVLPTLAYMQIQGLREAKKG